MMNLFATTRRFFRSLPLSALLGIVACVLMLPATTLTALAAPVAAPRCATTDTACVIAAGNLLIAGRLTALAKLGDSVSSEHNLKHITDDEANALLADVSTNETNLNTLKSKLDTETSAVAARLDVRNIFFEFRIYAVVLPRDYRQLHVDIERTVHDKLKDLEPQLQQAINNASSSEQAQLNALFSDYKQQVAAAEPQIDTATATLPTLTPASYNLNSSTYKANLKTVSDAEQAAHSDLQKAASDLHSDGATAAHELEQADPQAAFRCLWIVNELAFLVEQQRCSLVCIVAGPVW